MASYKEIEESQLLDDFDQNENDLCDAAKHRFPFYKEILKSLDFCGHSVLANERITPGGRHRICSAILHSYENVKNVLDYLATTPLQTKEKINEVPMVIICGLPRSGTTLLQNLMACDPACRAPLITDMTVQPIPPILRSNVDEHKRRMEIEAHRMAQIFTAVGDDFKAYKKSLSSSHAVFAFEEDTFLHRDVGVHFFFSFLSPDPTNLITWYTSDENKDFAYDYHQTVLQMLHDVDPPRTHWQLKSPAHTWWINTLLRYYPQASFIMSHRRLDEVIPSWCRYIVAYNKLYFNDDDSVSLKMMLKKAITAFDIRLDHLIEFLSRQPPPKNVFNIQYKDLVRNPIETVRRIYDHFDFLQWSDEFEQAMRAWILDNPQGKQGQHSYSLNEFGLENEMKKELYQKYEKMFLSA